MQNLNNLWKAPYSARLLTRSLDLRLNLRIYQILFLKHLNIRKILYNTADLHATLELCSHAIRCALETHL